MNRRIAAGVLAATLATAGCGSQADAVSDNISKEAEKFNVQRRIVGVNGITDKVEFEVEGRCSIEGDGLGSLPAMTVTCKHGKGDYRKHYITVPDNLILISTQLQGVAVSEYRTKIVLKPQGLIPDLDLAVG
jgi:hypothetical protein